MRLLRTACAECRCVSLIPEDRCAAIQALVRPGEIARHISRRPQLQMPGGGSAPERVAGWLQARLATLELRYVSDPAFCDRWCGPAETMRRGGGDCDDLAILAASLLLATGTPAFVMVGRVCEGHGCIGHAWVEGRDGRGRFHLEATSGRLRRGLFRPSGYHADLVLGPGVCERAA